MTLYLYYLFSLICC